MSSGPSSAGTSSATGGRTSSIIATTVTLRCRASASGRQSGLKRKSCESGDASAGLAAWLRADRAGRCPPDGKTHTTYEPLR